LSTLGAGLEHTYTKDGPFNTAKNRPILSTLGAGLEHTYTKDGPFNTAKNRHLSAAFQTVGNLWKCDLPKPHSFPKISYHLKAMEMWSF